MSIILLPQNSLYLPTYTPNLIGWWSASDINGDGTMPSDGTVVTTWKDKSGKGNHLSQATVGLQPTFKTNIINGKPAVLFDDTLTQFLYTDVFETGTVYTIQVVYKPLEVIDSQTIVYNGDANGNGYGLWITDFDDVKFERNVLLGGNAIKPDITSNGQDFEINSFWWDVGAQLDFMNVNGIPQTLDQGTLGAITPSGTFSLGFNTPPDGGGQGYNGYIQEVLFYNRTLRISERRQNEIYLSQMSGIALS